MPEILHGTTPESNECEKNISAEKVDEFLKEVVGLLFEGKKVGITKEELQDVVDKAMDRIASNYELSGRIERFKTENFL